MLTKKELLLEIGKQKMPNLGTHSTRKQLAEQAGMSERKFAQVETVLNNAIKKNRD